MSSESEWMDLISYMYHIKWIITRLPLSKFLSVELMSHTLLISKNVNMAALSPSYPQEATFLGLIYGTTGSRAVNTDGHLLFLESSVQEAAQIIFLSLIL